MNFNTLETCDIYADSDQKIRSHLGNPGLNLIII